jgi:DNA-binding PadR family transcriptional regulator
MKELIVPALGLLLLALVVAFALWDGRREDKREDAILGILLFHQELYGLDMVKRSGGLLKRGTIYITLGNLEARGLIQSRDGLWRGGEIPRRLYCITEAGREEALARVDEISKARAA